MSSQNNDFYEDLDIEYDKTIKLKSDADDIRIDTYISSQVDLTRSYIQKLIKDSLIKVGDKCVKPSYKTKTGDMITINLPKPVSIDIKPENIPLDILYEDDDIILVNKPQGMVVHPAPGNYSGTLVNALLYYCKDSLSGINGVLRPGIVHRLDKDTSGVILIAKNNNAHINISEQIKNREIKKIYNAIVIGNIKTDSGTINEPIGRSRTDRKKMAVVPNGRYAVTHYHVLERLSGTTYVKVKIDTGRTHQIRVHMAYIGHPVLGDRTYGPKKQVIFKDSAGQFLHARILGFRHPVSNEYMEIEAPLPKYFDDVLDKLRKMSGQ